uniref:Uncharacterized protein n=1 Tax=Vitis vinifera TaxID=29760 RepID=A5AUV2_VITVI|nr:hypothetical protein VITISV_026337 [Vitis vinifera]
MALVCQGVVSQLRNILRNFRSSFRSTLHGCLQIAITSSFQLQFVYHLKIWTPDFLSFETRYSMHEMDSRNSIDSLQWDLESTLELDSERANIPMGPYGPRYELIYLVGTDYEGWIGSKFTFVYKGILPLEVCQNQGLSHRAKDFGVMRLLQFRSSSSPRGFNSGTYESKTAPIRLVKSDSCPIGVSADSCPAGENGDLDIKNMKKNIQKCRSQISGSTKDHFASKNDVCEISQTHKKGCEITSQQKADFAALRSWLSACNVRLPTCHKYRETSGGIPQHCAKWLRNHFAAKG